MTEQHVGKKLGAAPLDAAPQVGGTPMSVGGMGFGHHSLCVQHYKSVMFDLENKDPYAQSGSTVR
jgi:hypothetical protein